MYKICIYQAGQGFFYPSNLRSKHSSITTTNNVRWKQMSARFCNRSRFISNMVRAATVPLHLTHSPVTNYPWPPRANNNNNKKAMGPLGSNAIRIQQRYSSNGYWIKHWSPYWPCPALVTIVTLPWNFPKIFISQDVPLQRSVITMKLCNSYIKWFIPDIQLILISSVCLTEGCLLLKDCISLSS